MKDNRALLFKWLIYAGIFFAVFALQTTVIGRIRFMGAHPNLFPVLLASVALFEGPGRGAAFGFFVGMFCDAVIAPSEAFFMILFLFVGLILGAAGEYLFKRNIITAFLFALSAMAAVNILFFSLFMLIPGRAPPHAFISVALPETAVSLPFTPVFYFAVKLTTERFRETGETRL